MRRKSYISPCKEINTEQMFKRIHLHPANFKPPPSQYDPSRRIHTASSSSPSHYFRQTIHNTISSSTTKNAQSGSCLKISQLLAAHYQSNRKSLQTRDESHSANYRMLRLTGSAADSMFRSRSFARSTSSKENDCFELHPFTSTDFNETDTLESNIRPSTGAFNVRIRVRTSVDRIAKSVTVQQELPDQRSKNYIPKIWRRLKTTKGRRKRTRVNELDSVVVGIKAM